jgi:hypothetical protein
MEPRAPLGRLPEAVYVDAFEKLTRLAVKNDLDLAWLRLLLNQRARRKG